MGARSKNKVNKKVSGFSQYRILLAKDIKQEFRTKELVVSMVLYAILTIVVYGVSLSFADPGDDFTDVAGGLIWAIIVFTSILGLNRSFIQEKDNDCIEGLLLAPLDRGTIFLAKATSNLLFLLVVEVVAVPLFWLLFSSSCSLLGDIYLIILPLLLGSLGMAAIGTLLSTITVNTKGKDVMLALIFIPVIFPLLYACVSATASVLVGDVAMDRFSVSLVLAAGYDVIMTAISWLLYQFIVSC